MTVMTLNLVEKQPATMRRIIGKHLAVPRWQDTCDYYNQMMERERLTVCFHAQLKQRHAPSSDYNNHMYPASEGRTDAYQLSGA